MNNDFPVSLGQTSQCRPDKAFFPGGEGTLGISGLGCAARTLEPLAYTRASFQLDFATLH